MAVWRSFGADKESVISFNCICSHELQSSTYQSFAEVRHKNSRRLIGLSAGGLNSAATLISATIWISWKEGHNGRKNEERA